MGETLTLKLRNPTDEQREMINSNECIYAQWNEPAAQPDPNRPCDTHGISGCERCFGWCDHGAPDPKDALTTARLEEALALTRALVAERDQLRARVGELEAHAACPACGEEFMLSDHRRMGHEIGQERDRLAAELKEARGAAHQHLQRYHDTLAERDAARAEITRLRSVCDERQASRVKAWKDRDAARAECEKLKAALAASDKHCEIVANQNDELCERIQRLEAQAARMRETLECIETGRRDGQPTPDALLAADALAETDAGGLVQGLVKALETIRGLAMMSARPPDSYTARIMDACTEALDAWNRCGRGRDGE